MADFSQRVQDDRQAAHDLTYLVMLLLLDYVVKVVPDIRSTLTNQPAFIELNADLDAFDKVCQSFLAQTGQPLAVEKPFRIRCQVSLLDGLFGRVVGEMVRVRLLLFRFWRFFE